MVTPSAAPSPEPAGFAARRIAAEILDGVLHRRRPLGELLDAHPGLVQLEDRDRALTRRLVVTVLRRLGTLRHLLRQFLDRGAPAGAPRVETTILLGAAQILWLDVPDHAAVDLAVRLARADRRASHYAGLVNAVLRRIAQQGAGRLRETGTAGLDTPDWLMARWVRNYGADTACAIALANGQEPALDLTVKSDPEHWAKLLGGCVLPTGTVRAVVHGPVSQLPGYAEGAWWVQDAAAALPARLFGDLHGKSAVDLCAAPGGKTAQLAAAGAQVIAVDRSAARLARVRQNLDRLALAGETVAADATEWHAGPFDAILLDAPCTSTGTIRRHPDVAWLKHESDIAKLAAVQRRLIAHAVDLLKPAGVLVYCTCSLEPEEGVEIVDDLLARDSRLRRRPIAASEIGGLTECISPSGDVRTLPSQLTGLDPRMAGLDGFYVARLDRV